MIRLLKTGTGLLAVLALSLNSAWAGDSGHACDRLPVETLTSGFYNHYVTDKRYMVVRSEPELEELEKLVGTSLDVNLDEKMVLGAFMGQRNTGGYDIAVTGARVAKDKVHVEVTLTSPGPGCMVTMALTSPYEVVALPSIDKALEIHERNEVKRCQ